MLFGTSVCWRYLEPGVQYNGHFNGRKDIMVFGNKSGSGGMVKNVSTSVFGSEISSVYLRLIFLLCPTCRDQQLVRHIHNGLILIILSILADPFLRERRNQDTAGAARPAVEKPVRILMDLALVGLVGH